MPPSATLDRMPWSLLFATSLGMFAAAASGAVRSPFLIDIARDLGSSVAVVANVLSVISVAWAVSAAVAGPAPIAGAAGPS